MRPSISTVSTVSKADPSMLNEVRDVEKCGGMPIGSGQLGISRRRRHGAGVNTVEMAMKCRIL